MKPFRIGLCMAGAVSAGAYTAGVMDYLLEALEDWEKRRGQSGVPTHQVTIPIMGGASAGGMTAMLTASTIRKEITPVTIPEKDKLLDEHPENKLYNSWVDLTHRDMFPKMLDTSDIDGGKIVSLLNSKFIDEVAEKMLGANSGELRKTPTYFESPVKVFTTLSNLGGFHYNVDFVSGRRKEKYNMSVHNDYACFEVADESMTKFTPGWIPLDFTIESHNLKQVSMEQRNETLSKINSMFESFENTILMIDPFPSKSPEEFKFSQGLFSVIGKTLSAMTSQMRAKPLDYRVSMLMADAGRFIISPSREIRDQNGKVVDELFGEKAIACGALAGFGGFLSKEFRIHDYYLGRYNCEIFLRDYFTVPPEALELNPIFAQGYAGIDKTRFSTMATGEIRYQIIPVFSPKPEPGTIKMPIFSGGTNWPLIKEDEIDKFSKPIKKRIQKIVMNAAEFGWFTSSLLWIGAKVVLNGLLAKKVMQAIKSSLKEWELMK
ncbi:patatin-like phospholipase family protein [Flavobacterium sp. MAH-1]|uniref:Patatin-like phospholipase family protein n=1 Tax=Flavobacterium agri TaxID=2743471 RepID=A0A7Y9C4N1_9FLAO|nr:patatin-like phospholipase family protein [Flavobacterium agri]NUY79474.1 patatin-like phospholipase family protein [Flavobacterium agri]NYA69499.1 patatin-like phospholipase family protein [Flavobacterium agri]